MTQGIYLNCAHCGGADFSPLKYNMCFPCVLHYQKTCCEFGRELSEEEYHIVCRKIACTGRYIGGK